MTGTAADDLKICLAHSGRCILATQTMHVLPSWLQLNPCDASMAPIKSLHCRGWAAAQDEGSVGKWAQNLDSGPASARVGNLMALHAPSD